MQVKKQQLEPDTVQRTDSKLSKYVKPVYCHPAYLTSMQSTCEMLGWLKLKIARRTININNPRYADDITLMAESEEELRNLMKVKEENEKPGLKLNIKKRRSWSHHFMTNRWGNNENNDRFYFLRLQNQCRW